MPRLDYIDKGKEFDWGKTSVDYAKYRDIYPDEFYRKIIESGLCVKGQRVLDLGTGTGVLPRNMYKYGAEFVGVDISENQIAYAKKLSEENGMNIKYFISSAEELDFEDNSFDVVTAVQCFMYFDRKVVLPKIHRMLKKDGHLCILFMSYLPSESEITAESERLILKYNPDWSGSQYKPNKNTDCITPDWCGSMFIAENKFGYDINVRFTREGWNGRMKTCRGIGASVLSNEERAEWEREHRAYLETVPESFDIPHWVNGLILKKI